MPKLDMDAGRRDRRLDFRLNTEDAREYGSVESLPLDFLSVLRGLRVQSQTRASSNSFAGPQFNRQGEARGCLKPPVQFAPASESVLQAEDAQLGARTNAPQRQTSQKRIRIHWQSGTGKAAGRCGPAGTAATFLLHP